MNVIISNKNKAILDKLDIEVIKRLDGEYSADEIIEIFQNFFFNKMIIDITAIKDYADMRNLQKLSTSFDMNKVILLLDAGSGLSSPDYLSKIISVGIYNFTTNLEGLVYLYNNPNSYSDVAQYHKLDSMILDEEPQQPKVSVSPAPVFGGFNEKPDVEEKSESNSFVAVNNPEESSNVNSSNVDSSNDSPVISKEGTKIIGIKSITPGAGATTLTYLMKKQLEKKYNVLAVEVEKRDFIYFNDNTLVSSANGVVGQIIDDNNDKDVILIDLNGSPAAENFCDEVLNLIEPSIIKVNRLLAIKPKILNELKNKKIILCPSMISSKDVKEFEYESALKVFYNLCPIDDHASSDEVKLLLQKLGFSRLK